MLTLSGHVELLFLLCFIATWTCVVSVMLVVVCLPRPMEGMGRLQFSDLFSTELPVPPQAAGVVGTFSVLDTVSHFLDLTDAFFFSFCIHFHFASTLCMCVMYLTSI